MTSHPHDVLSRGAHDRLHQHRKDQAWLDARWAEPDTRVLVVSGSRIKPIDGEIVWLAPDESPDGLRVLLGAWAGHTWFAVITGTEVAKAEPGEWVGLRELLPVLAREDQTQTPLVLHALGLAEWLLVTRFCPRDGSPLEPRASGHELVCTECGRSQFPRLDPAVIMLITDGEPGSPQERCLLGRQAVWPPGRFSTLAGFCEPGETLEDAVRREVREEVGVDVGDVAYFGNQPWPLPSSLMLGFTGRATSTAIGVDEDEIEEARWFTRADLLEQATDGRVLLPGGVSISHSLVEAWYGGPLPGRW